MKSTVSGYIMASHMLFRIKLKSRISDLCASDHCEDAHLLYGFQLRRREKALSQSDLRIGPVSTLANIAADDNAETSSSH